MSSCILTGGYQYPCRTNQGGVKQVWIGTFNDTAMTFTMGSGSTSSTIISFGGSTVSFFPILQRPEQASMVTTDTIGANGTIGYSTTVEVIFEITDASLINFLRTLNGGVWRLLVLDNLGNYWLVGQSRGCYTTAGVGGSGKTLAIGSIKTVTFKADEPLDPSPVLASAAQSLIVTTVISAP